MGRNKNRKINSKGTFYKQKAAKPPKMKSPLSVDQKDAPLCYTTTQGGHHL